MARLILLNGAPGVGKSTVGRLLVDARPLALLLDLDVVRSWLGPTDDLRASHLAARRVALAMAADRLAAGADVVVPQYLGRPEFIVELESLADATLSGFVEIVLVTSPDVGRARFEARGAVPQLVGADEPWSAMHARVSLLLATRPGARIVDAHGDVAATVALVEAALAKSG